MPARIPQIGVDGKRRLDCPKCGRLLFRYTPHPEAWGPLEIMCPRPGCKKTLEVYFNSAGPAWDV